MFSARLYHKDYTIRTAHLRFRPHHNPVFALLRIRVGQVLGNVGGGVEKSGGIVYNVRY